MRTTLAMIVVLSHVVIAQSQSPPESAPRVRLDLQPVESALTYHTPDYHVTLRQVLFGHAKLPSEGTTEVRMLVTPSFEAETLLTLHRVDKGWRAHVVRPPESLWTALAEKRVIQAKQCRVDERVIGEALGARLAEATVRMLERTRYQVADGIALDGGKHTFLVWRRYVGDMAGETHDPAPGTRPSLLADVADACIAYVLATDDGAKAALASVEAALTKLEQALAAVASPQQQTPR